MSKALVTGAGGFVGNYLVKELQAHGRDVLCVTNSGIPANSNEEWRVIDIIHKDALSKYVKNARPEEIYHLAAISRPVGFGVHDYFNTNVIGTLNLLECAKEVGANILVVSSAYAYGNYSEKIDEGFPLKPVNPYGASKAAQDILASSYSYSDNRVVCVRPFNHIGPDQSAGFLVPDIISKIRKHYSTDNKSPTIEMGDMSPVRDFLDVRDVVRAYRIIMDETVPPESYNVCSGTGYSVKEIFELCCAGLSIEARFKESEQLKRDAEIQSLVGRADKLQSVCSWRPQLDIKKCIADIISSSDEHS